MGYKVCILFRNITIKITAIVRIHGLFWLVFKKSGLNINVRYIMHVFLRALWKMAILRKDRRDHCQ